MLMFLFTAFYKSAFLKLGSVSGVKESRSAFLKFCGEGTIFWREFLGFIRSLKESVP